MAVNHQEENLGTSKANKATHDDFSEVGTYVPLLARVGNPVAPNG